MKTALLICGQLRSFFNIWEDLNTNVVSKLNTDIFICTWSNIGQSHRIKTNVINDEFTTESELYELTSAKNINLIEYKDEYQDKIEDIEFPYDLKKLEPIHSKNQLPLWYTLYKCNELKKEYELKNNFKYDCVIKIRPDIHFKKPLPDNIFKNLHMLNQWDFRISHKFQVCDKMAISNSDIMDYYCSVWNFLDEYYSNISGGFNNMPIGERLMRRHFNKTDIKHNYFIGDFYIKHNADLSEMENKKL